MDSVSEQQGQHLEPSGWRQYNRRRTLMEAFKADDDYQYRTQVTLRKLWQQLQIPNGMAMFLHFGECRQALDEPGDARWPCGTTADGVWPRFGVDQRRDADLQKYVREVERTVTRRRLFWQKQPATWALQYVHEHATGSRQTSVDEVILGHITGIERELTLEISAQPAGG